MIELQQVGIRCGLRSQQDRTLSRILHARLAIFKRRSLFFKQSEPARRNLDAWPLRDVSLGIRRGERVGLVGVNGAGKSTLMRVMAGVYQPSIGRVTIQGNVASLLALGSGFNRELTAGENIRLNGMMLGLSRREVDRLVPEITDFADLSDRLDEPVRTYSSGMVARLGFALGTAVPADILLIDEILAVGDGGFRKRCEDRLLSMIHAAQVICICSHNLTFLRRSCNRVIWINQGRVSMDGPVDSVLESYEKYLNCQSRKPTQNNLN